MLILLKRDVEKVRSEFLNEYERFLKEEQRSSSSTATHLLAQLFVLHHLFVFRGKEYSDIKNSIDDVLCGEFSERGNDL